MALDYFTDEQARTLINLEQRYRGWIEAERTLAGLPYDMHFKNVGAYRYLYEIRDRLGNGTSVGAASDETEARLEAFRATKAEARERSQASGDALAETGRLYRALRLPPLASEAGPILREADRRNLLGSHLLVVGTNAMAAYAIEAGGLFRDVPGETEDFDMAWSAETPTNEQTVWQMLKAVDATFTVNTERAFQARNSKAYEFELLVAPSRAGTLMRGDRPRPIPLPEQEWLLRGRPVDRVVACRDTSPARIVAPDPRWFALLKLWMADQPKRNFLKRPKDRLQGNAVLDAVRDAMPHYPLDDAFEAEIPNELQAQWETWRARPALARPRSW